MQMIHCLCEQRRECFSKKCAVYILFAQFIGGMINRRKVCSLLFRRLLGFHFWVGDADFATLAGGCAKDDVDISWSYFLPDPVDALEPDELHGAGLIAEVSDEPLPLPRHHFKT